MQIVIEVPDKVYQEFIDGVDSMENTVIIHNAVCDGTVLSKGHGRLVDVDKLVGHCGERALDCYGDCDKCDYYVVRIDDLRNAKTIIEADKEQK